MRFSRLFICVLMVTLSGCGASKYAVKPIHDKFSDPDGPEIYSMTANAIDFADPMGIVQSSELRPYVMRDRATGKVVDLGVTLDRVAYDHQYPHWLAVRKGDPLVFLADGQRVELLANKSGEISHKTERSGSNISTDYFEIVTYKASAEQLNTIASASRLEFKATGAKGSASWPSNNKKLLESFGANLRKFYQEQVVPHI